MQPSCIFTSFLVQWLRDAHVTTLLRTVLSLSFCTALAHLCAQLVLHMARDAKFRKKNFRFYHCFGDEDGMKHLKCYLAQQICCSQSEKPVCAASW